MKPTQVKLTAALSALALIGCAHTPTPPPTVEQANLQVFALNEAPIIGERKNGEPVRLGGFSGLVFERTTGAAGEEKLQFLTHTDRGPNEPLPNARMPEKGTVVFALPDFQPTWVRVVTNPTKKSLEVSALIPLRKKDGGKLTGLPNQPSKPGAIGGDEKPLDSASRALRYDPAGLDLESLAVDPDGTYWMGEEYRPSLIHFSRDGKVIERFVPRTSSGKKKTEFGTESLPEIYSSRRLNRGFEALALKDGLLYAFPQSPLEPRVPGVNQPHEKSRAVRVLQFDTKTQQPAGEFVYLLDEQGEDRKLGDAVALADGDFLVVEQTSDSGAKADKKLYRVSFEGATNLRSRTELNSPERAVELMSPQAMKAAGIEAAKKTLVADLVRLPGMESYSFTGKVEGLAVIDDDTIALVNDNDFGVFADEKSELLLIRRKGLLKRPSAAAP